MELGSTMLSKIRYRQKDKYHNISLTFGSKVVDLIGVNSTIVPDMVVYTVNSSTLRDRRKGISVSSRPAWSM